MNNNNPADILSEVVQYDKYARHIDELNRRETWDEIVDRSEKMWVDKYPHHSFAIKSALNYTRRKSVFPSMRGLQFGGEAIIRNNSRIFNCSYMPVDDMAAFWESMFLLLSGCGVGVSIQDHHIAKLPVVLGTNDSEERFVIQDSAIGWADAIKVLVKSYFLNRPKVVFDATEIRPKGAPLKTSGGKAPGPQPLLDALHNIRGLFNRVIAERGIGSLLMADEVTDILCYISDAVLAGGIRRAAMLGIFTPSNERMMAYKVGDWFSQNPQRQFINCSAMFHRKKTKRKTFDNFWNIVSSVRTGDPGILWTNDDELNWGFNPCVEASLEPFQFCNLVTINADSIKTQHQFNNAAFAAGILGTLQASMTDFHYLRPIWKEKTEKAALMGVSITGLANSEFLKLNFSEAVEHIKKANHYLAPKIGINTAERCTAIKPEGTSSLVAKTSSGVHAWWSKYYIRRMILMKDSPLYKYLKRAVPHLVENSITKPQSEAYLTIPVKAPKGAITRDESVFNLLNRAKHMKRTWIDSGHIEGVNTNNVSITANIKNDEWRNVGEWMWDNREYYNGIAVLPYDSTEYPNPPHETISGATYNSMCEHVRNIDLTKVVEVDDNTVRQMEAACAGGVCSI